MTEGESERQRRDKDEQRHTERERETERGEERRGSVKTEGDLMFKGDRVGRERDARETKLGKQQREMQRSPVAK